MRIGFGFDVHPLREGLELWLGGIRIAHTHGAAGHSDADVIIHALCDALLGAAALGDIGKHFPDTSPRYKGIDSKLLLTEVMLLIRQNNYRVGNVDISLSLEKPKIAPHIEAMKNALAPILGIATGDVSIKATVLMGVR